MPISFTDFIEMQEAAIFAFVETTNREMISFYLQFAKASRMLLNLNMRLKS